MQYTSLLKLSSPSDYECYYKIHYCNAQIYTFDNIRVFFPIGSFKHAFYESSDRKKKNKDVFSYDRAERMDWIVIALGDPNADLFVGWDNLHKRLDYKRRVAVVVNNYVVIIQMMNNNRAFFITAFIADTYTINRIRKNPQLM
jgi:hypothetical protein